MTHMISRRAFLLSLAALPFTKSLPLLAANENPPSIHARLHTLESRFGGRIGVSAINTSSNAILDFHAERRFPLCSTFKVLAAAAILSRTLENPGLLQQHLHYEPNELVEYSPITQQHLNGGMTVAEICAAAMQYSDNTAGNLMLKVLGGPESVTVFARSINDQESYLDRWEPELNLWRPGELRDTTTPRAMAKNLKKLLVGETLPSEQQEQLREWLCGNTTGSTRIKAGLPSDWVVGDKTGSGPYGAAHDVAIVWPPGSKPILAAIYTTQPLQNAPARSDVVAAIAGIVAEWATGDKAKRLE